MHAHSVLWFALAVFLTALLYRKLAEHTSASTSADHGKLFAAPAAALAGGLFLLDKNTYFPVMFVANRGFIVSLVFGLLCLRAHHLWRTTNSRLQMWASATFLLVSILANEGGASTLAFLGAYALVLEPAGWRRRIVSLAPAAVVLLAWRTFYVASGFGVRHVGGYIDPGYEPWLFLKNLPTRFNALLGGQLTGLPPESSIILSSQWQNALILFFLVFNVLCAVVLLPALRKDAVGRFWATVMLLALVPAATVVPLSKNMGFVAVGAFGMLGSFLVRFANRQERAQLPRPLRIASWCVAIWLVLAHVGGALVDRFLLAQAGPLIPKVTARWCSFGHVPDFGDHAIVILNNPSVLSTMEAPFYRAYHGLPLPSSIDSLIPGSTAFAVERPDARTLLISSPNKDLFECDSVGPVHMAYVSKAITEFMAGGRTWYPGDQVHRKRFRVEIREVSARKAPSSVAFHFQQSLETEGTVWLYFDWIKMRYSRFSLPGVGERLEIAGPRPLDTKSR